MAPFHEGSQRLRPREGKKISYKNYLFKKIARCTRSERGGGGVVVVIRVSLEREKECNQGYVRYIGVLCVMAAFSEGEEVGARSMGILAPMTKVPEETWL